MSRTKQVRVSRVADWSGWCSPCESEDRPLVLTRTGPAGPAAWLAGLGDDDRFLLLTCNVCGSWQVVPPREEDDPEVVLVEDDVVEAVAEIVHAARAEEPEAPRVAAPVPSVVAIPAPRSEDVTLEQALAVEAVLEAAAPAPRAERIVTVPDTTTLPAFSPEAVAAARRVLAAARAETQRTAPRSGQGRPAPLDRSRRTRSTATGRRTSRPAAARVPAPRPAAPAVATSIVLPGVTAAQVVLAAG